MRERARPQEYLRRVGMQTRTLAETSQLNGGLRSRRREPAPARRHTRAIQSASPSVTRLAITRTAMFISSEDRIAIGPVDGRKRGMVRAVVAEPCRRGSPEPRGIAQLDGDHELTARL